MNIAQFLEFLSEYRMIFIAILDVLVIAAVVILASVLLNRMKANYESAHAEENRLMLRNMDYSTVDEQRRATILRQCIVPDAVDPGPNGYLVIDDGGREVFARSFTIDRMPKRTRYANTFSELLNFASCTSSIFVEPIPDSEMSRKLDKHIVVLESEHIAAEGDTNRQRKLRGQYRETERLAEEVESGNEKFFYVRFLFTLIADDLERLNKLSDEFRGLALNKQIAITSTYGVQAEAFVSNLPLNRSQNIKSKYIKSDALKAHLFDRPALSTIFNYTESSFSHKNGAPLGRNLFTRKPFVFDVYDPSHDGFLMIIAGKTGSGKSVTIKVLCERYAPLGYRFVAIDSQARKGTGEGEYAALAEILNGVNFQLSNRSGNILNIYDVQESLTYMKDSDTSGYEVRTLELSDKITLVNSDIRTMMSAGESVKDDRLNIYLNRIISDANLAIYNDLGIYDKQPDSLYEMGRTVVDGKLSSGLVPKKLPTITDFYKKILVMYKHNQDPALAEAYRMIIYGMKDYVRELYYSEETLRFFSAAEYNVLPDHPVEKGFKLYTNEFNVQEKVTAIHGIRPYFDGQSTINISKNCPFTNIDISQLTEFDKVVAREIAMGFVNEQFIKKNSESIHSADKLLAIFDEAHENFAYEYARIVLANAARTARKRNVGLIFCTQTIMEFDRFPETQDILKQAAVKMVCKQDAQDKKYLMEALSLTDSQANLLTNFIGYSEDDDEETKNKHRGEMCVVDSNKVSFVKVDMIKATEEYAAETSAAGIEKIYTVNQGVAS